MEGSFILALAARIAGYLTLGALLPSVQWGDVWIELTEVSIVGVSGDERRIEGHARLTGWPCRTGSCPMELRLTEESSDLPAKAGIIIVAKSARLDVDGAFIASHAMVRVGAGPVQNTAVVGRIDSANRRFVARFTVSQETGREHVTVGGHIDSLPPLVEVSGPSEVECSGHDFTAVRVTAAGSHSLEDASNSLRFTWGKPLLQIHDPAHASVTVALESGLNRVRVVATEKGHRSKPASIKIRVRDSVKPAWTGPDCIEAGDASKERLKTWMVDTCDPDVQVEVDEMRDRGVRLTARDDAGNVLVRFVPYCSDHATKRRKK